MNVPSRPKTSRAATLLWAGTALATAASAILTAIAWGDLKAADAYPAPASLLGAVAYASLGAVIVRRVGNRVGWVLLYEGLALALVPLTSAYAVVGMVTDPGSLPAAKVVGTLSELIFIPASIGILYALLIFPTGTPPSSRWRWVAAGMIAASAVSVVGFIITPRQVGLPAPGGISLSFPNPFAIGSPDPLISNLMLGTIPSLSAGSVLLFAATAWALVVRYRSGGAHLRQQIKWVAYVAAAWVVFQAALAFAQGAAGSDSAVTVVAGLASGLAAILFIPGAITLAILRYRLYDIDLIINRTLVYGALTAILAGTYVVLVTLAGTILRGSAIVTAGATLSVAALFQPLRRRIQGFIDRRFYRSKYDAAMTVEVLSSQLRDEVDLQAMRADLLAAVQETMQPKDASIWLRAS